jgi:hypothetical protein
MRHDIIKTDNYLLVVDDDSEINDVRPYVGRWHLEKGSILNKFPTYLTDLSECKIVLTHFPLNGAPYLDGLDVLPRLNQDDDIEKLFNNCWIGKKVDYNTDNGTSFKEGYNIAREKYNLTLEKLIDMYIEKTGYGMDMWSKEENETMSTVADIIQSINQPKLPISFECEVEPKFKHIGSTKEVKGSGSRIKNKHAGNPKTFINSEGRIEWVGKYIYE